MGFFSGITKSLLGGSESSGSSTSSSGLNSLSPGLQRNYGDLAGFAREYASPEYEGNADRFTPIGFTPDEEAAFSMIREGVAPKTSEDVKSLVDMFMNPYGDVVIDDINREFEGQNSLLKSIFADSGSGPMGASSNRSILSTVNLEDARLRAIASARKDMYDTALNTALGRFTDLKQGDITNLLGIGDKERALDYQTKQAPIQGLLTWGQILNPVTQLSSATKSGSSESSAESSEGIGGTISGLATAFSDIRLKEDITLIGEENGINVYEFNYIGDDVRYRGVMAQEIEDTHPEAVTEIDGYLAVHYDKIGIEYGAV